MSTTAIPDRFTTLPDEPALQTTVVAMEEHGFSVEVAGDLDAARQAVLARIPAGSSVMTNASVAQAFHAIERVEQQLGGNMRFAFRHFPLTGIHPHALAAAAAAEAAALQGRFWDMHELLFHRQKALEDADLLRYAARLGLDMAAFDRDRTSSAVADRIRRDVDSGLASDQVLGTPTLFIDGVVHRGGYDPPALLAALAP